MTTLFRSIRKWKRATAAHRTEVFRLTPAQAELALRNALRYVPEELHETLAPEFMEELKTRGRIYAYRYRPEGRIYGKPIDEYKGKCIEGKGFSGHD